MTPERAHFIALATIHATRDYSPAELVQAFNEIAEIDDEVAGEMLKAAPGLLDYDDKGNWIGPMRNENGWTA